MLALHERSCAFLGPSNKNTGVSEETQTFFSRVLLTNLSLKMFKKMFALYFMLNSDWPTLEIKFKNFLGIPLKKAVIATEIFPISIPKQEEQTKEKERMPEEKQTKVAPERTRKLRIRSKRE
jgi:hypothetical protein